MYQYLQLHSVKEPSRNHDIWVRVVFSSLRGRVHFGFLHIFLLSGSVLDKTWALVWFVLAVYGFFAISQ